MMRVLDEVYSQGFPGYREQALVRKQQVLNVVLTLKVPVTTIDALRHFETG